jgi:glutamate---cysteine ligase / carboxylate-amine ligase
VAAWCRDRRPRKVRLVNTCALTVGVEEEFLLVDAATRLTAPRAATVLARTARMPAPVEGMRFQVELAATQVEAATGVCADLELLRGQLRDARACLAAAAGAEGLRLVATGNPVLTEHPVPFTPGDHYGRLTEILAGAVTGYESCGCHVHVGVADRELAVGVLNHLRPWLPTLLALSVNSPFDQGRDSGYGSWRIQAQSRFPGFGVPPWFPSATAHDRRLDRLIELGVLPDAKTTYWLARPSPWLPTVEVRAADAASTVDEAVLQAALTRALVLTALVELARGREAPQVGEHLCAAAVWSAARYGLTGPGIHPLQERRVDAAVLVNELVHRVRPALEEAGDLATVRRSLHRLSRGGTGAARQRAAAVHGLPGVVDMLVHQTGRC